ncbi:hypothetical protein Hanom_Chr07g00623951 [Helianthus anomalus]
MCRQIVLPTESRIGLMYFQMKDFQPNVWMGDVIINCFASMLNYEEAREQVRGFSATQFVL